LTAGNPEAIERFLRALIRANVWIADHPKPAGAVTAKRIGIAPAELDREMADYRLTAVLDQSLILYLEDQARWLISTQAPGSAPNFLDYIYTNGLEAIRPEAVRIVMSRE